jgi:hypothetical protein
VLWPVEWLFSAFAGSRPVPGSRGTFVVACHRHHGAAVRLPDGTTVRRGDRVAEIHFWNRRIARRTLPGGVRGTWQFVADFRHDLGALARALQDGVLGPPVVAVCGVSPLALAAPRFGFTVRPLRPGLRRRLLTAWQGLLRRTFAPRAAAPPHRVETTELWLSMADLLRLYADPSPKRDGGRGPAS